MCDVATWISTATVVMTLFWMCVMFIKVIQDKRVEETSWSDMMGLYDPRTASVDKTWEERHADQDRRQAERDRYWAVRVKFIQDYEANRRPLPRLGA